MAAGFIGLNNLKNTDYINVVVQALAHIPPLRDYFLANNLGKCKSPLVLRFGELIRKMWSPHNFKNTVRSMLQLNALYATEVLIMIVFCRLVHMSLFRRFLCEARSASTLESRMRVSNFFHGC